ncbi:MAG: acetyl-CoA C-acetyltransferase [Clostridiales Family XIII bacterium]|jgi:acetyl-CoA C-acetyltransferase|nr:acetyl-CoA C-acetyltransferase [Clostridiales Family XIII bacterium]
MNETVIAAAGRTPFGKHGGALKSLTAADLGGIVIGDLIAKAGIEPASVDYAYIGQVLQGGCGQVPSRQAARKGGLPWETPSITVNKVCSSGIISVALANMKIRCGDADTIVAGGMESMSNAPYYSNAHRWGARMGNSELVDLMIHDGLWCAFYDRHMAVHGSEVSKEFNISREAQDEFACRSQMRAIDAMENGRLSKEIVPVEIVSKKGSVLVDRDEAPRADTNMESLSRLRPVFTKDGTVTAGNAPGVNDGAAMLLLMSKARAKELGLDILATIVGHEEVSQEAKYIATVPGLATNKLLNAYGLGVDDIALFEANEAFAAVALISGEITKWDVNKVNVDGGAIAFGHPIGASGARILMHLAYALRARGGGYGVACICSGAAQGDAMLIRVE